MSNLPLVSIIIPTYNRKELLKECLNSISFQKYSNWECIIVDDHSSEPYWRELKEEFNKKDLRFRFFLRPLDIPSGASSCRNYGFLQSSGKYIQWLDDDDLISENKILNQVTILEAIEDDLVCSVCSWDIYWPEKQLELKNPFQNLKKIKSSEVFKILGDRKTFIPCSSYLVSSHLIKKAGFWDSRLSLNDDAEFFSRVITESVYLLNIPSEYVLYRAHSGQRISEQVSSRHIESHLLSMNLMQAHINSKGFECKEYFKWKLLQILFHYEGNHNEIIRRYSFLFDQYGLFLQFKDVYIWKYRIYKKVYPFYKKYFKK